MATSGVCDTVFIVLTVKLLTSSTPADVIFAIAGLMIYYPLCEMYVGAVGVECAMSWSQRSLFSTGHSAREFLWAE